MMSQERLNGLSILSIEDSMLEHLDYKTLISSFAAEKVRKMKYFFLLSSSKILSQAPNLVNPALDIVNYP